VGTANRTGLLIYTGIFSSRGSNILVDTSLLGEVARHSRLNKFHNFVAVSRRELFAKFSSLSLALGLVLFRSLSKSHDRRHGRRKAAGVLPPWILRLDIFLLHF